MKLQHCVESQQFTVPLIMELFERTREMEKVVKRGGTKDYENRIMASLYYRPSTRTRFSFEAAMYRLGGKTLSTEQAREFSSEIQGEQLEDTIRQIGNYCDAIVLRHEQNGAAKRAAKVSSTSIINAGEGEGGQHPTQALLDLYTIYNECGTLDGLSVALIGELDTGRTARSLAYLLSKFYRTKLYFIAPKETQVKSDILAHLDEKHVEYELAETPRDIIGKVDAIYQTRIHPERLVNSNVSLDDYSLNVAALQLMKKKAAILHPLPRSVEISREIDADPRAAYFRQAKNGLTVRMALLSMLFDEE